MRDRMRGGDTEIITHALARAYIHQCASICAPSAHAHAAVADCYAQMYRRGARRVRMAAVRRACHGHRFRVGGPRRVPTAAGNSLSRCAALARAYGERARRIRRRWKYTPEIDPRHSKPHKTRAEVKFDLHEGPDSPICGRSKVRNPPAATTIRLWPGTSGPGPSGRRDGRAGRPADQNGLCLDSDARTQGRRPEALAGIESPPLRPRAPSPGGSHAAGRGPGADAAVRRRHGLSPVAVPGGRSRSASWSRSPVPKRGYGP